MQSKATTVDEYLAELPDERRAELEIVRQAILEHLDADYEEGMQYGMIGYYVPHRVYPAGYHCDPRQPLPFAGLAAQKNHLSLYLMCVYGDAKQAERFQAAWAKTGKKLDMGRACIRFKRADDLALDLIGQTIAATPAKKFIQYYESTYGKRPSKSAKKSSAAGASPVKTEGRVPKKK